MLNETQTALGETLSDVLEKMAFMFAEESSKEELPALEGPALRAWIAFKGPTSGVVSLWVPSSLCPELAANVLGMEPDDELCHERGLDALKELLNVTCGQLLTTVFGEEQVFDLTPPLTETVDVAAWQKALAEKDGPCLVVEDRPTFASVELKTAEATA